MGAERYAVGRVVQFETPDWRPLAQVGGEHLLCTFMWMYELETPAGGRFHAYKHIETRRYVHLDHRGNAFAYVGGERYRRVPLAAALELALKDWWEVLDASTEDVAAAWTAIARAHRSLAALEGE